jgi:hypothetical protein
MALWLRAKHRFAAHWPSAKAFAALCALGLTGFRPRDITFQTTSDWIVFHKNRLLSVVFAPPLFGRRAAG